MHGPPPAAGPGKKPGSEKFSWQDGAYIWLTIKVDPTAVAPVIPPGTTLASDVAQIFCVWYPTALLNEAVDKKLAKDNYPYHEMGVRLSVKRGAEIFRHIVYIMVDDDVALFLGRDFMGTPKKMGVFDFPDQSKFSKGEKVKFSISRNGKPVMAFAGVVGADSDGVGIPGLRDNRRDLCIFANQFPHYCTMSGTEKELAPGQSVYVTFTGTDNYHMSRHIDSATASFAGGEMERWFVGQPLQAGFLSQDWKMVGGIPLVGLLPSPEAALQHWASSYPWRY